MALTLIGATHSAEIANMLGMKHFSDRSIDINQADREVAEGDCFVCYGTADNFKRMMIRIRS